MKRYIRTSTQDEFEQYEDDIKEIDQEFTSENTSINSTKLPAVFKMISFEPGTVNLDFGGGRFDNVADYLTQYDVINLVYDPYNRTKEHNQEVVSTLKKAGGADSATCSNVLNVIKEPEVRQNVLQNIKKLVKPNGKIYITVYEGTGKGDEGPTKSGYQLNKKTADYLEEIQQVFPDATRKGKLIQATNSGSVSSATMIKASIMSLEDEIYEAAKQCMIDNPSLGFLEDEVDDYLFVDVSTPKEHPGYTKVEVRAELGYDGLCALGDALDPIVAKYDEDSYFEAEAPGILSAYLSTAVSSSTKITAAEYDDVAPDDDGELIFHVDDIVVVDEHGDWQFESDECPWASEYSDSHGLVYDENNHVYLGDEGTIIENVIDLLYTLIPGDPGRYQINCTAVLAYEITGMESRVNDVWEDDYGREIDEETITDNAEGTFVPEKSYIEDFTFETL